jgi:hypothetical protein
MEDMAVRSKYPSWGARKLKARLQQLDSSVEGQWPVPSGTLQLTLGLESFSDPDSRVQSAKKRRTR